MKFKRILHLVSYHIGLFFTRIAVTFKYNYKHSKRLHLTEPTLILGNHTTESDMIMLACNFYEQMYIVCGEHLFRTKFGKLIKIFFDPIPACKGGSHLPMIKAMTKRLKAGYNIMLFPEGSRSFNGITEEVNSSIGKLVKMSKCGLATFHTEGGYFVAPRWGYHFRKGPVKGEVRHLLSSAELAKMTPQEITDLINKDLYENAYESQRIKPKKYKGKGLAEGLENYLIICPECNAYDSMVTEGDHFECSNCGLSGRYTEEGFLTADKASGNTAASPDAGSSSAKKWNSDKLPYDSVADWGKWIEKKFDSDMADKTPEELLFTEKDVRLYSIDAEAHTTSDIISSDSLLVYSDRMVIGDHEFLYKDISEEAMLYFGKSILFTHTSGYFGLTGEAFHAWKASRLYRNYQEKNNPKKAMNAL